MDAYCDISESLLPYISDKKSFAEPSLADITADEQHMQQLQ